MLKELLTPEVQELIEKKDWKTIKNIINEWPPVDIADFLKDLSQEEMVILFRLLSREKSTDVFSELEASDQEFLLRSISDEKVKEIIYELPVDDRTELFEELPGNMTQKLMNMLTPDERKIALDILGYPYESVGRLITPDYVAVKPYWNIARALNHIRSRGEDAETINMIYVVDDNWHLLEDIPIRRFILSDPNRKVSDILAGRLIKLSAYDDQEEAVHIMKKYDLVALPVVDSEGILIGIVTIDDILDVLEEEVTEDFHKSAAISPITMSYIKSTVFFLYRKRIIWLLLLLFADFFSSGVISHFENALHAVIALAFFIPVLTDSGGNTASQSSTLIIRAMATGDLALKKWLKVFKKEFIVGLLLGISLGLTVYFSGFFWKATSQVGIVIGTSMIATILWANLLGSLLPILLTKLKLDPAIISSPLLSTMIDSTSLIIYFSVAEVLLRV